MKTYTFDTNCLIDLIEQRPTAAYISKLIEGHRLGRIAVAFVAVSASERQQGDYFLPTYDDFVNRLTDVGVADVPQISGMAYFDISYRDHALYASDKCKELEKKIHECLFPNLHFEWSEYANSRSIAVTDLSTKEYNKWRNAWCDRQMIWSHIHHKRRVFVTSDQNFRKLQNRDPFPELEIATPELACTQM